MWLKLHSIPRIPICCVEEPTAVLISDLPFLVSCFKCISSCRESGPSLIGWPWPASLSSCWYPHASGRRSAEACVSSGWCKNVWSQGKLSAFAAGMNPLDPKLWWRHHLRFLQAYAMGSEERKGTDHFGCYRALVPRCPPATTERATIETHSESSWKPVRALPGILGKSRGRDQDGAPLGKGWRPQRPLETLMP